MLVEFIWMVVQVSEHVVRLQDLIIQTQMEEDGAYESGDDHRYVWTGEETSRTLDLDHVKGIEYETNEEILEGEDSHTGYEVLLLLFLRVIVFPPVASDKPYVGQTVEIIIQMKCLVSSLTRLRY
jgi:hypothetical protein